MPLARFRRPLFLLTAAYILLLCALHGRLSAPPDAVQARRYRFLPSVVLRGRVISPMKEDRQGRKVLLRGLTLAGEPFTQTVLVHLRGEAPLPGQVARVAGRLRPPRPARNPGDFDERALLADRGVSWVLRAETAEVEAGPVLWSWRLWFWAERARRDMEAAFKRSLSPEQARLAAGLTLGYKGPLPAVLNRQIQDAGVMHLLVPSGAKVAFVMMAALWLFLRLGLRPGPRLAAAALVGGFYTLMVGADAPYARAYLGGLVLLAAPLLDRSPDAFQAMTLSALALLLYEPRQLFTAGFQMTYLAVLGLVVGMPRLNAAMPQHWPRWLRNLAALGGVSVIVQLMLWPIFARVFGRGSVVGVLANLILVPASGFVVAAGFLLWSVSAWPLLAEQAAGLLGALLSLFVRVCQTFASLPGAAVDLCPMSAAAVAAYFLTVFAILLMSERKVAAGLLAAAAFIGVAASAVGVLGEPAMRLVILRLPRSRPTLVTFSGGRHWLVDPGGPAGMVLKALRVYGVGRLEKVVLTGREEGRALGVLRARLPVASVERRPGLKLCEGLICAQFGGRWGPRLLKGEAEYSIIASRLRTSAVEVTTDGVAVHITETR